jgi:polyferredoxin
VIPLLTTYRAKCRLVLTLSTIVIVVLPFLNVLRLDIPTLRFYFFDTVLWVDEFHLLFLILMLGLWAIVFFSMLYGRVWCGWMCPQTAITWLTRWFESNAARWLGFRPRTSGPVRRVAYHAVVSLQLAALCLVIGFNLVAYFVDPYRMLADLAAWNMNPLVAKIMLGIAILVFVDALFWREKFCTKACPYGMLQLLVTDANTQITRYHTERAEECLECGACERACRTGIDIRKTPYQTECIYCGECIDACDKVMGKQRRAGLITFSWGEQGKRDRWYEKLGFVDAKRWIILGLTVVYTVGLVALIGNRQPLSLSAAGDRSTLYRQAEDGRIVNDYTVRASNRSLEDGVFLVGCRVDGAAAACSVHLDENPLPLQSRETRTLKMAVSAEDGSLPPGPSRMILSLQDFNDPAVTATTEVAFFMPDAPPAPAMAAQRTSRRGGTS